VAKQNDCVLKYLILYWFKWQTMKSGKRILGRNFGQEEADQILQGYWQRYLNLKPDVPQMPSTGGRIMVQLAAMSTAFYWEINSRINDEKTSTKIFYDIAWVVYEKMGMLTWKFTGWQRKSNISRLTLATKLFRRFPFNSPSYLWSDQPGPANTVCFDCLKCPVATYFATKNLSKFCAETWCAFDFPLAELWGGKLERSGSIAGGSKVCDFKWISASETGG
jgi:L-2-amino-thiazoline-4-carboxylic acid hydrolase-like protein